MSLSTTVRQIDLKDDAFCAACARAVRRHPEGTEV
jgi:predicted Zn-dependent protease